MRRATFAARKPAGRTMTALLDRAGPEEVAPPERRSLQVGAADDHAEHEADAVAEQVLARIGGSGSDVHRAHTDATPAGAIGAAGGALDDAASGAIESARGGGSALDAGVRREMESGFGRGLGDVRIHTDARADQLSRQMSARAFTTGRDIFFARGEYDPSSASGRHTLAHELAHTVQDGGGVHRKLRGTAEALRSQGEIGGDKGKSTKGIRKVVGKLTHWDEIVAGVKSYEAKEAKLLDGGKNPDPMTLMSAKPGMLKTLNRVLKSINAWRKANDHEGQNEKFDKARKGRNNKTGEEIYEFALEDNRTKTPRRQAVAMLESRVTNEIALLSAKDSQGWLSTLGLSGKQVVGQGKSEKGQVNDTKELHYQSEQGEFSGYFKQDLGFNLNVGDGEVAQGIRQVDPNYGARSVALYRLDRLFDAGVTARAEFAVHTYGDGKSRMGTVLETAKGTSGKDLKTVRGNQTTEPGTVSLDDPALQRGLNKLQLLDAIAGQLDRHGGNYKVQQDEQGKVTGVTGIDLDMGFAPNMASTDRFDKAINYKGLPDAIDEQMGQKILQVKASDLVDALTGLLTKQEIDATVQRFIQVQEAVKAAEKNGRLKKTWGDEARGTMSWEESLGEWKTKKSYQDNLRNQWRYALEKKIDAVAAEAIRDGIRRHPRWKDMPSGVADAVVAGSSIGQYTEYQSGGRFYNSPFVQAASQVIFELDLGEGAIDDVLAAAVAAILSGLDASRVAVDVQERKHDDYAFSKELKKVFTEVSPKLLQQFKR